MRTVQTPDPHSQYRLIRNVLCAFCFFTFLLYLFGPIPWVPVAPVSLAVIFLSYSAFWYGSRSGGRQASRVAFRSHLPRSEANSGIQKKPALLVLAIFFIVSLKNSVLFSSPFPPPAAILSSYEVLKKLEEGNQIFAYVNFFLSPLLIWLVASLMLNRFNKTSRSNFISSFLAVVFYIYSVALTGSGNAILELIILVSLLHARHYKVTRMTLIKLFAGVLITALILSAVLRPRLDNLDSIAIPVEVQSGQVYNFSLYNSSLVEFAGFIMSFYVTNGYQGFQYSEGISPDALWHPLAASKFMQRQYEKLGLLPQNFEALEAKVEKRSGWPAGLLWGTTFLWLRENVPLLGLPLVLYFIGVGFYYSVFGYLTFSTPFRLVQSMLMVKVVLFLPLNAISLATGEEMVRTMIFLLIPAFLLLSARIGRVVSFFVPSKS